MSKQPHPLEPGEPATAVNPSPQAHSTIDESRKWGILSAIGISLFLSSVDGSIVNVALPTLLQALNTSFATVQWVVLSYLLGVTVLMIGVGRLADLVGKKQIFTSGLILFVLGSVLCGLAPNVYWLIGFRFVQSIGAAMMLALGVAIVTETWPDHERGKAIGATGGIISFGVVAGPALGGFILEGLGWRWIFMVNLPIGLVALWMVLRYVPSLRPRGVRERFDFLGAGLLAAGLLTFTLSLTLGQEIGFTALPAVGLFLLSMVLLPLFVWTELRVDHPMLDLSIFRSSGFGLNLFNGLLTFVAIAGVVFLLPFFLELVVGLSQRNVGLAMSVVPVLLAIVAPLSGTLSDRLGTRPVTVVGLGLILFGYLGLTTLSVETTALGYIVHMIPIGLGMATFQSPNNSAIMGAIPRSRLGVVSGILSTTRTMGQTIGIAVLGTFFSFRLHAYTTPTTSIEAAAPQQIVEAMHDQMLLVAAMIAVGFVLAVREWMKERSNA
ncbi:DHA2 family efflux MFS transporter permease subunit [bacterium]|nr:DHA2 family efflux MFS transporter permease subunit [bacterium]